jgi:hypothetical protein
MSQETKDILVEITSVESIEFCKKVMEELIIKMFSAGITLSGDVCEALSNLNVSTSEEDSLANKKRMQTLFMQQVKVVDSKTGKLKHVYPSRVDLNFDSSTKIETKRMYDD